MPFESGDSLGRYTIERRLGSGAMGDVHLARDPRIDRRVALKTLRLATVRPGEMESMSERLLREARAAGRLIHPHIVTLFDAGEHDGLLYLAFEYVAGSDLAARLRSGPPLALGEALRIAGETCDGLAHAHAAGLVHRDVKPSNLLLTPEGRVKISDFGIAKLSGESQELTVSGTVMGSPHYLSPEQVRGEPLDGRSDLFSLGIVLYEMIAGRRPFDGETLTTLVYQILHQEAPALPPLRAGLSPAVPRLLAWFLAKDREQRVPDARAAADALARLAAELPRELLELPAVSHDEGTLLLDEEAMGSLRTLPPPPSGTRPAGAATVPPPPPPGMMAAGAAGAGGGSGAPVVTPASLGAPGRAAPARGRSADGQPPASGGAAGGAAAGGGTAPDAASTPAGSAPASDAGAGLGAATVGAAGGAGGAAAGSDPSPPPPPAAAAAAGVTGAAGASPVVPPAPPAGVAPGAVPSGSYAIPGTGARRTRWLLAAVLVAGLILVGGLSATVFLLWPSGEATTAQMGTSGEAASASGGHVADADLAPAVAAEQGTSRAAAGSQGAAGAAAPPAAPSPAAEPAGGRPASPTTATLQRSPLGEPSAPAPTSGSPAAARGDATPVPPAVEPSTARDPRTPAEPPSPPPAAGGHAEPAPTASTAPRRLIGRPRSIGPAEAFDETIASGMHLVFRVRPDDAYVLLDGTVVGQARDFSPAARRALDLPSAGEHTIVLRRAGMQDRTIRVEARADGPAVTPLVGRLLPSAAAETPLHELETHRVGKAIGLRVTPADARVLVDGRFVGPASQFAGGRMGRGGWLELPLGMHRVSLVAPGHRRVDLAVDVTSGALEERKRIQVVLPPEGSQDGR